VRRRRPTRAAYVNPSRYGDANKRTRLKLRHVAPMTRRTRTFQPRGSRGFQINSRNRERSNPRVCEDSSKRHAVRQTKIHAIERERERSPTFPPESDLDPPAGGFPVHVIMSLPLARFCFLSHGSQRRRPSTPTPLPRHLALVVTALQTLPINPSSLVSANLYFHDRLVAINAYALSR